MSNLSYSLTSTRRNKAVLPRTNWKFRKVAQGRQGLVQSRALRCLRPVEGSNAPLAHAPPTNAWMTALVGKSYRPVE